MEKKRPLRLHSATRPAQIVRRFVKEERAAQRTIDVRKFTERTVAVWKLSLKVIARVNKCQDISQWNYSSAELRTDPCIPADLMPFIRRVLTDMIHVEKVKPTLNRIYDKLIAVAKHSASNYFEGEERLKWGYSRTLRFRCPLRSEILDLQAPVSL